MYLKSMFGAEIRKIIYIPENPTFPYMNWGFTGFLIAWTFQRDDCKNAFHTES